MIDLVLSFLTKQPETLATSGHDTYIGWFNISRSHDVGPPNTKQPGRKTEYYECLITAAPLAGQLSHALGTGKRYLDFGSRRHVARFNFGGAGKEQIWGDAYITMDILKW